MAKDTRSLNFEDALVRISGTSVECFEAGLSDLRYAGQDRFRIGPDAYKFGPEAWSTVAHYLDIQPDLFPQLGRGLGDLVVRVLHKVGRRSKDAPERLRLAYDGRHAVVSVSPANLACLTNQQVVAAVRDAWPSRIPSETLSVRLDLSGTDFELACHTSQLCIEPRRGDILHGGITIRHSQVGASPTVVLGYIYRLVCTNGMTQRVCLEGRPSRTKRSMAQNSPERVLDAIRRQVAQAWVQIDQRLEGMKTLLERRLEADELPEGLRRRWSINRAMAAAISAAMQQDELGPTHTEYDLVNALARIATHTRALAPRYRRHLSLAAGMLAQRHVHQCPVCGNWSVENVEAHQSAATAQPGTGAMTS